MPCPPKRAFSKVLSGTLDEAAPAPAAQACCTPGTPSAADPPAPSWSQVSWRRPTPDCKRDSLLRGSALSVAERWLASRPPTTPPPNGNQPELISASPTWANQCDRRWVIDLSAMAISALSLAGIAYWQQGRCRSAGEDRLTSALSAEEQRNLAEQRRFTSVRWRSQAPVHSSCDRWRSVINCRRSPIRTLARG